MYHNSGFEDQSKLPKQMLHCNETPSLCNNEELKKNSRAISIESQILSKQLMYMECEKNTLVNENQGIHVQKDLFIDVRKSSIYNTTNDCKKFKIKGEYLDYQLSNLSDTNEIIACSMILPYQQDSSLEGVKQLDIKEVQGNMTPSEVPKSKYKKNECKDGEKLCIEKVEKKDVNENVNTTWKKRLKAYRPTKRRGRPKKIHIISPTMIHRAPHQVEKIPLKSVEKNLSSIPKNCGRANGSFHKIVENLNLKKVASCIDSTQSLNSNQNFQQIPFSFEFGENHTMKKFLVDLQSSSTTSTSLKNKRKDILHIEETWIHRGKSGRDGKPRNRAVMDILGLGVEEMPKIERVFTRKKSSELSTTIKDKNYNNNTSLQICEDLKKEDSNELMTNKSMVSHLPTKRGRGRPRKWPLRDTKKDNCIKTTTRNDDISKSIHKFSTSFHGKRTHRKSLLGNKSFGCARCSISGWTWRHWTRNGAKHRLRHKNQKTKSIDISFWSNMNTISSLQSARTNRATLRKLVIAAEGSDIVKFNQLKVHFHPLIIRKLIVLFFN